MNNNAIGVFDSGLGGLSCLKAIEKALPNESVVYFGDTARAPYGDKTVETIQYFTCQIADFLVSQGVKMLVIACNTISALCTEMLEDRHPYTAVVDIINPAATYIAKNVGADKNVGIIATKATVNSKIYEKLLRKKGMKGGIYSMACPLFVPLIENGFQNGIVVETVVQHYLDDFIQKNQLTHLVLGCTHYPFIESSIRKLYPELEIINPSKIMATEVDAVLKELRLEAESDHKSEYTFYASDLSDMFLEMIKIARPDDDYSVKFKAFKEVYDKN